MRSLNTTQCVNFLRVGAEQFELRENKKFLNKALESFCGVADDVPHLGTFFRLKRACIAFEYLTVGDDTVERCAQLVRQSQAYSAAQIGEPALGFSSNRLGLL